MPRTLTSFSGAAAGVDRCERIDGPLRFDGLVRVGGAVLGVRTRPHRRRPAALLARGAVIEAIVISATSAVHEFEAAALRHVPVPTRVVRGAGTRVLGQCTRIWKVNDISESHRLASCLRFNQWKFIRTEEIQVSHLSPSPARVPEAAGCTRGYTPPSS